MSALPRAIYTLDEYFALERASERRFEFRDGEIVCMSGGTVEHATIAGNVLRHIGNRVAGGRCRVFNSDIAVFVPAGKPYRYPDVTVVCGELVVRKIDQRDALENPCLLVEVLSESSASYDRGAKFAEYKSISTFEQYLLIDQTKVQVACRSRLEDGTWVEHVYDALDDVVPLRSIGLDLVLRDVYESITFKVALAEPEDTT
jgi:Uma2 family endonuclease